MSIKSRRKFSPDFKAKVSLDALKERETIEVLCKKHDLHPTQINQWKKELQEKSYLVFDNSSTPTIKDGELIESELIGEIGKL